MADGVKGPTDVTWKVSWEIFRLYHSLLHVLRRNASYILQTSLALVFDFMQCNTVEYSAASDARNQLNLATLIYFRQEKGQLYGGI